MFLIFSSGEECHLTFVQSLIAQESSWNVFFKSWILRFNHYSYQISTSIEVVLLVSNEYNTQINYKSNTPDTTIFTQSASLAFFAYRRRVKTCFPMHPAVRVQLFPFSPILLTTRNDVSPSRHQTDNVYFLLQKIQSKSCIELVALLICFSDYTNIFELFFDLNQDYGCISDWKVSYPARSDNFLPLLFWSPIRLSLSGEASADSFLKALS